MTTQGQAAPSQGPPNFTALAGVSHINATREVALAAGVAKSPTWVVVSGLAALVAAGILGPLWLTIVLTIMVGVIVGVWAYVVVVPVKRGDYTALWSERGQLTAMLIQRADTAQPGDVLGPPILDLEAWRSLRGTPAAEGHLEGPKGDLLPGLPRPDELERSNAQKAQVQHDD